MVSDGHIKIDDILGERIASLNLDRDRAKAALDRVKAPAAPVHIDPASIALFGSMMRDNLTSGSIEFRKAYIRSVVERIECEDNVIRIVGNKTTLEQLVAGGQAAAPRVRSFERKWRSLRESNPSFQIENLSRRQEKQRPFRQFLPWHRNGGSNA